MKTNHTAKCPKNNNDDLELKEPKSSSLFYWLNRTFTVVLLITLAACGGGDSATGPDPEPEPEPEPNRNVSYSQDIQPIFSGSCAGSGCHIPGPESGVSLGSYDDVINSVGTQYGTEIVEPGEPENSPIVDKISNDNPEFGVRMPKDGSPLSQAEIDSIVAWIEDGAPDN